MTGHPKKGKIMTFSQSLSGYLDRSSETKLHCLGAPR